MHANRVALLALSACVSCVVDAALPVRPDPPTNDNNDKIANNGNDQPDEDEFWSRAFSAILSQDSASADSQQINPDDWRRYIREANDLPEGITAMFGLEAHADKKEEQQQQHPSWNPGYNSGGNRRRFLHVDEIPPLPVEQHPRLLQAVTLDDLLGPVAPPPPGAATTSNGNRDDNNNNRAPQPYDNRPQYTYNDKDDGLHYRWQQGDAENAAAGPGGIMTKKVIPFYIYMYTVFCLSSCMFALCLIDQSSSPSSARIACVDLSSSETPKTLPPWVRVGRERNTGMSLVILAPPFKPNNRDLKRRSHFW